MTEFDGDKQWELFYWANMKEVGDGTEKRLINHMIGRGEFVRLMFEVAGVSYIDHGVLPDGGKTVFELSKSSKEPGQTSVFPIFAPPIIRKGNFVLSQTPAIMKFLGQELGLYPTTKEDIAHADSLGAFVTDFIAEGRLVFHARCFTESYYSQADTDIVKTNVAWYKEKRLPQFMNYLEVVWKFNNRPDDTKFSSGFFVGDRLTYVDIAVFHTLCAAASQFPEEYAAITSATSGSAPSLEPFRQKIAAIPALAAYLASPRRGLFEGNSMM
mmetsp:Transcript_6318/g.10575  ORF Transcript_6318/g.10575 Transcript_6318/m.10575 type:complete len:270 (+) Transcript_6318:55-864(+)